MLSRVRHHLPERGDSVGAAWKAASYCTQSRSSVGYLFALRSQLPDDGHAVQQKRTVRGHSGLGCTREMLGKFELALQRDQNNGVEHALIPRGIFRKVQPSLGQLLGSSLPVAPAPRKRRIAIGPAPARNLHLIRRAPKYGIAD
ncbi:hypothetical protein OIDMADRAFT_26761 [Oidiodendron maius Zn]|uniref:Uncharacterized protein n=1 Tax=Oidiodendron maius (strain Zn) TaxID=913774 RepID=A0A0C3HPE6_OIDMZ|nr:hypothetical protein OIDMADRAFT_26761 [Oidiodendron maius Zn]